MTFFSSPTSLNRCTLNQLKHRACKTEVAGWLKRDRDHLICSWDGQEVFKKEQSGPIMQWCIISHKEEVDVMGREGDRPEGKFCQLHSFSQVDWKQSFAEYIIYSWFQKERANTRTLSFILFTIFSYTPSWCLIAA